MAEHFLSDIEILDFKCFKDFKAGGFKRVNLIGGKNNVGKTAFMEACYINVYSTEIRYMLFALYTVKYMRESLNLFDMEGDFRKKFLDSVRCYKSVSNLGVKEFEIVESGAEKNYKIVVNGKEAYVNTNLVNLIWRDSDEISFIDNFGWTDDNLIDAFNVIQKKDKESELNAIISSFDDSITSFKVIGDKPQCRVVDPITDKVEYRDIVEFGDGLKHYISIICALYACENGYLFIDEIDNGVHYTQLDNLWKLIFDISRKTNCQVFSTTHSKEMLESFARVARELGDTDISYTTLVKNKSNEIKALVLDYEMLVDSVIDQAHEVR